MREGFIQIEICSGNVVLFIWESVYFYEKWQMHFLQKKNVLSNNRSAASVAND